MSMSPTTPKPPPTSWVLIIGVMVAIGPLAIDMYLPALPSIAEDLQISVATASTSVTAYFIGLVFGQLFYGPFSDRVGRVLPMYIGMAVFAISSMVCANASNEYVLFVARVFQALGGCVTAVVTKAAMRDVLTPKQMAKALSLVILVMGLAPILAPNLGALILRFFEWHKLFWVLTAYALLNIVLTKLYFKETLPKALRNKTPISQSLLDYWHLLHDSRFLLPAVAGGLLQGAFFVYLASASELFMVHYGASEENFALLFGANALGFVALTQLNQFLTNRFRLMQLLRFGAMLQLIAAFCLLGFGLIGDQASFWGVFMSIFCCVAGLGFTQPNAGAIALAHQQERAGLASAAQGALQFSVGIFGGLLLSMVHANIVLKLGVAIVLLVVIANLLLYRLDGKMAFD